MLSMRTKRLQAENFILKGIQVLTDSRHMAEIKITFSGGTHLQIRSQKMSRIKQQRIWRNNQNPQNVQAIKTAWGVSETKSGKIRLQMTLDIIIISHT